MRPTSQTTAGLIIFLAALAGIVALEITGHPGGVANVMLLTGPLVAALITNAHTTAKMTEQTATLEPAIAKIDRQTNGILDSRILDGVRAGLAEQAPLYQARHEP